MRSIGGSVLVGRSAELDALATSIASLERGRGGVVWIEGEPGIGKSLLVDTALSTGLSANVDVGRGSADELLEAFPLRLMADCLAVSMSSDEPVAVEVAQLLRGGGISGVVDPVLAASERLLELVDRRCARRPMLLVAEDLHWADDASLLVWNRLARAVDQLPLLLVGTCRPVPSRSIVRGLRALVVERGGTVIGLAPLTAGEVRHIAAALVGPPGHVLSDELDRAGGNPFYVRELLEALSRENLIVRAGDGTTELVVGGGNVPNSLAALIGSRLRFLPEGTLRSLRTVALLGSEFSAEQWAIVTGQTLLEVQVDVDHAAIGGVVDATGERLRFRHELIRQVLVGQTPPSVRSSLQERFAQQLAAAGCDVHVVASQLLAAPPTLRAWAIDWLAELPEVALYSALDVCVQLLRRATASVTAGASGWEAVATRLALALFWRGQADEAVKAADEIINFSTDPELSARMRILAARRAGSQADYPRAVEMTSVFDDEALPDRWRARLLAWNSIAFAYLDQPEEARRRAQTALEMAKRSGDPLSVGYANHALRRTFDHVDWPPYLDAALAALTGPDPESVELRALTLCNRWEMSLQLVGPDSDIAKGQLLAFAEHVGSNQFAEIMGELCHSSYESGNWDDVLAYVASLPPTVEGRKPRTMPHSQAAMVALRREQPDLAAQYLEAMGLDSAELAGARPSDLAGWFWPLDATRALLAQMRGDLELAYAWRRRWLAQPFVVKTARYHEVPALMSSALEMSDAETVSEVLRVCDEVAPNVSWRLITRCCRALVADDPAELIEVAAGLRHLGWKLMSVQVAEEAAVRLARAGEVVAARSAFTDAMSVYDDLGASWDVRRLGARLRPFGIRRGPRTSRRRTLIGWPSLTPAEQRVAVLAAQGLSNPDIARQLYLSRNTIQFYVSTILSKLNLQSRIELRDVVPPRLTEE